MEYWRGLVSLWYWSKDCLNLIALGKEWHKSEEELGILLKTLIGNLTSSGWISSHTQLYMHFRKCYLLHNLHAMHEDLQRRNREKIGGPLSRTLTRCRPFARYFNLSNHSHHNITICALPLHHGNTESPKTLEQKFNCQLGSYTLSTRNHGLRPQQRGNKTRQTWRCVEHCKVGGKFNKAFPDYFAPRPVY